MLARKYFQSHGPATLEDFVWWSGLNFSDCRKGMDAIGGELLEDRWKRQTFYFHENSRLRGFRSGRIHLLPAYDEYFIGYKSRHVSLHPDFRHYAHDNSGTFWNVVLADGEVVGNWALNRDRVLVKPFRPDCVWDEEALKAEIDRFDFYLAP